MRDTRNGFQLMSLLYSVHDIKVGVPTASYILFFVRQRTPSAEQEQSPCCIPEDISVWRASLPYCSEGIMEWPHLCHIRIDGMCYRRGSESASGNQAYQKNPFSSETGSAFLQEISIFMLLSAFLKADIWLLTAHWSPVWKDPSYLLDLLIGWSWGQSPKHWSCPLSSESERDSSWHPGHHSDDTIY